MAKVIVTGAASGIGRSVVRHLVAMGASILLVDRDAAGLDAIAEECGDDARVILHAADLGDPAAANMIVDRAISAFGGLDGIVSNAGAMKGAPLIDLDPADFDYLFAVNTRPTWLLGKAAHPYLKASRGAIVATASIAADHPAPPLGSYAASKAALVMLVRQMALEWGPDGIRCNCVSPGPTLTPMNAAGYADPVRRRQREDSIPLRKLGAPDDIADAIIFLLGRNAGHISGQNLTIDGGLGVALMALSGSGTGQSQTG